MDKENKCCDLAMIERGIVKAVSAGQYTIESYGRSGLTTPAIPALHTGESYAEGDKVYFFLFGDGHGAVLGKFA